MAYLTIVDSDEDYLLQLVRRLEKMKVLNYEIKAFSDMDSFLAFSRSTRSEILMIGEELIDERAQYNADRVLSLTRDVNVDGIYRYQSVGDILQSVIEENRDAIRIRTRSRAVRVAAICSAGSPFLRQMTGLVMLHHEGERLRCLYLCTDGIGSVGHLFADGEQRGGLSEILYFTMQEGEHLMAEILKYRQRIGSCDVIAPAEHLQEPGEAEADTWVRLFAALEDGGFYDEIVVEVNPASPAAVSLLRRADIIYYPVHANTVTAAIDERWLNYMADREGAVYEKIRVMDLYAPLPPRHSDMTALLSTPLAEEITHYVGM
ncbi:MAG: hypothetical protein Q4P30_02505 [Eubacteriales bacterium]|nr:hypothetical protein [Eubacteriales bacterium]